MTKAEFLERWNTAMQDGVRPLFREDLEQLLAGELAAQRSSVSFRLRAISMCCSHCDEIARAIEPAALAGAQPCPR